MQLRDAQAVFYFPVPVHRDLDWSHPYDLSELDGIGVSMSTRVDDIYMTRGFINTFSGHFFSYAALWVTYCPTYVFVYI